MISYNDVKLRLISSNFEFFENKHKIEFTKKFFNYENTRRKIAAGKNIRKSETIVSLPTCACSNALTAVRQAVAVLTVAF